MDATPIPTATDAEDAHTIGRKGARGPRVELITRGERRRVWTLEQKQEIVAESLGPDLTPTEVARKHAISSGLLYGWRQQILGGQMSRLSRSTPNFAEVETTPAPRQLGAPDTKPTELTRPSAPEVAVRPKGLIEILLPGGVSLRVDAHVDGQALCRVLAALQGR